MQDIFELIANLIETLKELYQEDKVRGSEAGKSTFATWSSRLGENPAALMSDYSDLYDRVIELILASSRELRSAVDAGLVDGSFSISSLTTAQREVVALWRAIYPGARLGPPSLETPKSYEFSFDDAALLRNFTDHAFSKIMPSNRYDLTLPVLHQMTRNATGSFETAPPGTDRRVQFRDVNAESVLGQPLMGRGKVSCLIESTTLSLVPYGSTGVSTSIPVPPAFGIFKLTDDLLEHVSSASQKLDFVDAYPNAPVMHVKFNVRCTINFSGTLAANVTGRSLTLGLLAYGTGVPGGSEYVRVQLNNAGGPEWVANAIHYLNHFTVWLPTIIQPGDTSRDIGFIPFLEKSSRAGAVDPQLNTYVSIDLEMFPDEMQVTAAGPRNDGAYPLVGGGRGNVRSRPIIELFGTEAHWETMRGKRVLPYLADGLYRTWMQSLCGLDKERVKQILHAYAQTFSNADGWGLTLQELQERFSDIGGWAKNTGLMANPSPAKVRLLRETLLKMIRDIETNVAWYRNFIADASYSNLD